MRVHLPLRGSARNDKKSMGLANAQYDEIMRGYDRRRELNRHLGEEKLAFVYQNAPAYRELEEQIAAVSVAQTKKYLGGDDSALGEAKSLLAALTAAKAEALRAAGIEPDYLAPIHDCPDCRDSGYVDNKKCHCLRQSIIDVLYEQSRIRENLLTDNFAHLEYGHLAGEDLARFRTAVDKSLAFCKDFGINYQNLCFYGTVGTGKTFLSSCIAGRLLDGGFAVIYYTAGDLFDTLSQYAFDHKNKDELRFLRTDLSACDLLIIDDLGAELSTNFSTPQLFSLLNGRHQSRKATIISTNLTLGEMLERYSERIFSRISLYFELLRFSGADIRIVKKKALNTERDKT